MKVTEINTNIRENIRSETIRSKKEKLLNYYEEAGPDYATWSPGFNMHFGYYEKGQNPFRREKMLDTMNLQILKRLHLGSTERKSIADLGCGLGATLRYARNSFPDLELNGVTIVPWQVRKAREMDCHSSQFENIRILEEDYRDTSLPDNSQDGVYAIESSCYATGKNKADLFKEMHRILKPGGRFVIADGFRKNDHTMCPMIRSAYDQLCKSWALEELGNIRSVKKTLRKIGFHSVVAENISLNVAPSVAHVPFTVVQFLIYQWLFGKRKMTPERWNNLKSPLLTMIVGLAQRHFGYFLVAGVKE